jgi:hypothetical protein
LRHSKLLFQHAQNTLEHQFPNGARLTVDDGNVDGEIAKSCDRFYCEDISATPFCDFVLLRVY